MMSVIQHEQNGVVYHTAEQLDAIPGLVHGFSTRLGGVSQGIYASMNLGLNRGDDPDCVRENYRRFLNAIGAEGRQFAMCNQVHGSVVRTITTADVKTDVYGKLGYEADGMMTALPGVTLVVFAADCIPVLLCDPVRRVIAAVHAGWRGTAYGIVTEAVSRMKLVYGCKPENIRAAIGPGIGPCCFETHEDVPNAMTAAVASPALPYIKIKENGKFTVDLKGINARRLELAGLDPANIAVCDDCTSCMGDKYWSHRKVGGDRGSMAAMIELR
jgi:hypothetical protein